MNFKRISIVHNDHDVPKRLIREALNRIDECGRKGQNIVEFGKVIGFNNLVEVNDEDTEFFECVRGDRSYPSRFVKNRLPQPCTRLAVIWHRVNDDLIRVITAYFTDSEVANCPDEPGNIIRKINRGDRISLKQIEESYAFWSKHAFVEPIPHEYLGVI